MTQAPPADLVLVDGASYLFRAFHALPPLTNSKGQATGAVKGVINMIRSLLKSHGEAGVAIVFDASGGTFRDRIYSEYKAHRPPMPDELRAQIQPIHDIVTAMGLPLLIVADVEADDVIGTLATAAAKAGRATLVSTGDKDLAQLVNDKVTLINTMKNEVLDEAGVKEKFGVPPNRIIDYLALMGDKSDNIPGVPGVGPKTAVKWLAEYDSMEGIIANAAKIGGKVGERLRDNIDMLRLSYRLATIKTDVALDFAPDSLVKTDGDPAALLRLFTELEFRTWIRELKAAGVTPGAAAGETQTAAGDQPTAAEAPAADHDDLSPPAVSYECITSAERLRDWVGELAAAGEFALWVEALGEHVLDRRVLGIALCPRPGRAAYLPLGHQSLDAGDQLDRDAALAELRPLLEDPALTKYCWDMKQALHVLQNHGIDLRPVKSDLLLASYVVNSVASKHALPEIARGYLDATMTELASLQGKGRGKLAKADIELPAFTDYAAANADMTLRLTRLLERKMAADGHLAELYRYFELPLVTTLRNMERRGIKVEPRVLHEQSRGLEKQLASLAEQVASLAGENFNLDSPKQLQAILYDKLKLPVLRKTATGQASTAEPVLLELAADHELPRLILDYRSLAKLKSTYTDKLPEDIHPETERIHTTFAQAVAATGRLSSIDPNLQNIPIRTDEGRRVRQAFVSEPGYRLMSADYSQVELRIMAHLSRDAGLLAAFSSALDVHKATAAEVFGLPLAEVSPEQRRSAKAINFGLIYGMSPFGLAKQLNIPRGEAARYVERYFERYPGVRRYMDETRAMADEKGYVETLFGRRLYLPAIRAGNAVLRKAAQRAAINAPMQGTAADIIKRAMIDIENWLRAADLDARMLLQVHDELIFEVAEADLDLLVAGVTFRMVTAAAMDVPLVVGIGVGDNWDEAH